jgi:hypothetical protein
MINTIIGTMVQGAKTLLGKKSTKDILKYLATVSLTHLGNKYRINQYKYDSNDMKNMIYHYNMNNNTNIGKNDVEQMIDLSNMSRFISEIPNNNSNEDVMLELVNNLVKIMNDKSIDYTYHNIKENNIIQQFDTDTLETSSIADNYEISSGGIYLPNKDIYTSTIEGCILADAKNDYLEKRCKLGEDTTDKEVKSILNDYYDKIDFDKVAMYFNN